MTSNLGADRIMERFQAMTDANRDQIYEETRREILQLLRQRLRPEFLNRVDEVIVFHQLTKENIRQIVDILFERHVRNALLRQGLDAELTENAKKYFADSGYDPVFGARPLKRLIQKELINEISTQVLEGNFKQGDKFLIDLQNGSLVFTKTASPTVQASEHE